jgi:hypothetical protein
MFRVLGFTYVKVFKYVCLNNWNDNLFESSKILQCAIIFGIKGLKCAKRLGESFRHCYNFQILRNLKRKGLGLNYEIGCKIK